MRIRDRHRLAAALSGPGVSAVAVAALLLLSACEREQPRSFEEFMDDDIAREGVLVRCRAPGSGSAASDMQLVRQIECANARQAAAAIALAEERERRKQLEIESDRRIEALRARVERQEEALAAAQADAEAAAREAYERRWREAGGGADDAPPEAARPAAASDSGN
jgi:hypothetical protein